ncbi:MAG: hypothetical protein MJ249_11835 [Kiritimatiellae bacterium]|nr:hypothetical protein [Kiritimatiellia bacterium]
MNVKSSFSALRAAYGHRLDIQADACHNRIDFAFGGINWQTLRQTATEVREFHADKTQVYCDCSVEEVF